jgi:hypothetical protein
MWTSERRVLNDRPVEKGLFRTTVTYGFETD